MRITTHDSEETPAPSLHGESVAVTTVIPEADTHTSSEDSIVSTLRAATFMLARRLRYQNAGGEAVSLAEATVLGRLSNGPQTPGQLAKAEHVRPPSMTQTIARLEARGFVQRDPHPDDGRQTLVSRTPVGDAFVDQSRAYRTAWLATQFDKLDAADQRALTEAAGALRRLAELP